MTNARTIAKSLSANDTGESGGHQAGILVPKDPEILGYFPTLDKKQKNPRHKMLFMDESKAEWEFTFIYYNNKFFGGTRNEFRLTGMTRFIREKGLKEGDELIFHSDPDKGKTIRCKKMSQVASSGAIKLKGKWKVIKI